MAARKYEMNFGSANAGGMPVFTYFVRQDTGAALAQPAIVEAPWGNGAYYFEWDWRSSPAPTVSWMATLNGVEVSGVETGTTAYTGSVGNGFTLADAISLLQEKVLETTGSAIADATKAANALKEANRTVWKKGLLANPSRWLSRTPDITFDAAVGELAFDDICTASSLSAADLALIQFLEIKGSDGRYYPSWPTESFAGDRFRHEPSYGSAPDARYAFEWYIEGDALRLTPPPGTNLTLRLVLAEVLPDPLDNEPLLAGKYAQHHDLVITKAAILLYSTDEERVTPWDREYKELMETFLMDLARGGQGMRSRRVSPRDPFNS
jgi:hypothetical protein